MKIVCLSDTHHNYDMEVPEGDVLVHAGDFSSFGQSIEISQFARWLKEQPHKHKLFIWGNHEIGPYELEFYYREYIENEANAKCIHNILYEVEGFNFFGSSFTPIFNNWAFMKRGEQREKYWETVPNDVDILVTHGPPFGLLDQVEGKGPHLGCKYIRKYLERVKPLVCIFGHIHSDNGIMELKHWDTFTPHTRCVNASLLNDDYKLVYEPRIVRVR